MSGARRCLQLSWSLAAMITSTDLKGLYARYNKHVMPKSNSQLAPAR